MLIELGPRLVDLTAREVRGPEGTAPLSEREVHLLELLLARAPQTVPHEVLRAQGGALDAAIARLRAKLERDPRRPDHLLTTFGEGYRLLGAHLVGQDPVPALASPELLVGRRGLLQALAPHLESRGCLWLSGPPGVGKSTLARALLAGRPAVVVDLAGAGTVEAAIPTELRRALSAPWVILDNAEVLHAGVVAALTGWAAARGRVVVTSRLDCPVDGVLPVVVSPLEPAEAEQLWWELAHDVRPGLADDPVARASAQSLLEHLGGLPLAIELAAARLSALPLGRLTELVARRVDVLGTRVRRLETALEVSWSLLEPLQRRALAAFSLFQGVFGAADARALLGEDAQEVLGALVRASLVQAHGEEHQLLAPVRVFARQRLEEGEGFEVAARAYVTWVDQQVPGVALRSHYAHTGHRFADRALALELAQRLPEPRRIPSLSAWLDSAAEAIGWPRERKIDSLRVSLATPGLHDQEKVRLLELMALAMEGEEGLQVAHQAVTLSQGGSPEVTARALATRASLFAELGQLEAAEADLRASLSLAEPKSPFRAAWVHSWLAEVLRHRGRVREARERMVGALAQAQKTSSSSMTVYLLIELARTEHELGRYAAAQRTRGQPVDLGEVRSRHAEMNLASLQASLAREDGRLDEARHLFLLALAHTMHGGGRRNRWHTEGQLALLDELVGDPQSAVARFERVEQGLSEIGDHLFVAYCRLHRAQLLLDQGQPAGPLLEITDPGELPELKALKAGLLAEVAARRGEGPSAWTWLARAEQALEGTELVHIRHRLDIQRVVVARHLGDDSVALPEIPELEHAYSVRALFSRIPR